MVRHLLTLVRAFLIFVRGFQWIPKQAVCREGSARGGGGRGWGGGLRGTREDSDLGVEMRSEGAEEGEAE
jgi:hypothetical protein